MLLLFDDAVLWSQCSHHHRQQECMQINYFSYPFRVLGLLELLVGGAVSGMVGNADEEETRAWTGEGRAAASSTMLRCSFRNSFRKSDWYVSPFRWNSLKSLRAALSSTSSSSSFSTMFFCNFSFSRYWPAFLKASCSRWNSWVLPPGLSGCFFRAVLRNIFTTSFIFGHPDASSWKPSTLKNVQNSESIFHFILRVSNVHTAGVTSTEKTQECALGF